jgi:hypothetical protein
MPPLTRWFVKLSLVYFVAALTGGVWQAAGGPIWLTPITIHLLVVGWVTGMIFGVAYWMFPKFSPERPRGVDRLAVASFVFLNTGLLLRVVAEPLQVTSPSRAAAWLLVASAILQWLGALAFVLNTWPRVKGR